jgi:hypothetical protein
MAGGGGGKKGHANHAGGGGSSFALGIFRRGEGAPKVREPSPRTRIMANPCWGRGQPVLGVWATRARGVGNPC